MTFLLILLVVFICMFFSYGMGYDHGWDVGWLDKSHGFINKSRNFLGMQRPLCLRCEVEPVDYGSLYCVRCKRDGKSDE